MGTKESSFKGRNAVIINGATRINGNTEILIDMIMNGAGDTGVKIERFDLRKRRIGNCMGCYHCYNNSDCAIQDDMQKIYNAINRSELIIFASPLYWWTVTGIMKTFIDRLYFPNWNSKNFKISNITDFPKSYFFISTY